MTESRPSGPPRHAEARSSDPAAANPLQRPLPPGMGRRSAGPAAPEREVGRPPSRAAAPQVDRDREPGRPPSRAAGPEPRAARAFRAPRVEPATVAGPGAEPASAAPPTVAPPTGRRARAAANAAATARPSGKASAIPLMAPPAWQVAEMQADERELDERTVVAQRGLPGWAALAVLLVITGIGGLIDALAGAGIKGTFSIGLIVGALVAILLVRRSAMFPIVVAPPLVYFIASAVLLYVRSGGLSDRAAITDAAASWLVYGFPAIAGATAVVLIVAGARMMLRR